MSPLRRSLIASIALAGPVLSAACSSRPDELLEDIDAEDGSVDGSVMEGLLADDSLPRDIVAESSPDASSSSRCPEYMVEIKGEFCPSVLQECLRWLDKDHTSRFGVVAPNMCAEFRYPSTCLSPKRVSMHLCIDRYEWPNRKGETPATKMTWIQASQKCQAIGKRLCGDDEWAFACEGPKMKPYPYGDGYHRDSDACNADRKGWLDPLTTPFEILDHRAPSGAFERCHSDWGVHDIVGNVDEWVFNTRGNAFHYPWVSGLMGGHWAYGIRNRCRAITDSHAPTFSYYVTGARCCSNPSRDKRRLQ